MVFAMLFTIFKVEKAPPLPSLVQFYHSLQRPAVSLKIRHTSVEHLLLSGAVFLYLLIIKCMFSSLTTPCMARFEPDISLFQTAGCPLTLLNAATCVEKITRDGTC